MIILSSGGWESNGTQMVVNFDGLARAWAASGFTTYVVEHTALNARVNGLPSGVTATVNEIQWFDLIKSLYPSNRVSMKGISSGGHLALLVAANRPNLSSVITEASPTNITTTGTSYSPINPLTGVSYLEEQVTKAFDPESAGYRTNFSPVALAFGVQGLIPHPRDDALVSSANADWAPQPNSRPGLVKWIPDDYVCDGVIPAGVVGFGHSCPYSYGTDGLSSTSGQIYGLKQIYLAALGQHI